MSARLAGGPTERQAEALTLLREGKTVAEVARIFGISDRNAHALIKRGKRREEQEAEQPEGVTAALEKAAAHGADMVWLKSDEASIRWTRPKETTDPTELFRAALDDLAAEPPVAFPPRPAPVGDNLLVVDLADVHVGKLCVEAETGHRYDRGVAVHRMKEGTKALLAKARPHGIGRILFVLGNDILHVDGPRSQTTSGTYQDSNGTARQMYSDAFAAYVAAIDACAEVAPVDLLYIPSNHDWLLGWCLAQQVGTHFRADPSVSATAYNLSERHRKYYRFGSSLLGFTHGDGAKEADLPHLMVKEMRPHISECLHRYWYVHHIHHKVRKSLGLTGRKLERDHIGMTMMHSGGHPAEGDDTLIEYVRSPSPADGWHDRNGYVNRQAVECFIHHSHNGQEVRFTEWF